MIAGLGPCVNRICQHYVPPPSPSSAAASWLHACPPPTPLHLRLQLIRNALAAEQPDAVLFTGDMVSGFAIPAHDLAGRLRRRMDASLVTGSWFEQQWLRLTEPLRKARVPWATTLGNHDAEVRPSCACLFVPSTHRYPLIHPSTMPSPDGRIHRPPIHPSTHPPTSVHLPPSTYHNLPPHSRRPTWAGARLQS